MKASEAKPLSVKELKTLQSLLGRWILRKYPYYGGSSEESDAYTTYETIDPEEAQPRKFDKHQKKSIKEWGESEIHDI